VEEPFDPLHDARAPPERTQIRARSHRVGAPELPRTPMRHHMRPFKLPLVNVNELAVMLDCYQPLSRTAEAAGIEDAGYQESFVK
jgi:hypothetical protein